MIELGGLVWVGAAILGLVALARTLIEGTNRDRVVAVACLVIAVVALVLVANSDFGNVDIVADKALSTLNGWSLALLGVMLAGTASAAWQGLKGVSKIGSTDSL